MDAKHSNYGEVIAQFNKTWASAKGPVPTVVAVFELRNPTLYRRFIEYEKKIASANAGDANTRRRFHGTNLACQLDQTKSLCSAGACAVCGIAREGLKLAKFGTKTHYGSFGRGLYFANNSSKSADYAAKPGVQAMFLCKVVCGKVFKTQQRMEHLLKPPAGCHAVVGEVGGDLHYSEIVFYEEAAVLPTYVILYR